MNEDKKVEVINGEVRDKADVKKPEEKCPSTSVNNATKKSPSNAFTLPRKLVADYSSESGSSSEDSESDSSDSVPAKNAVESEDSLGSSSEDDLEEIVKPVEEISITAPPEQCKEVGKVKNILDNQVVVEPNVGLAALDLDTVLFLDEGRKPFGRVDDVFGPITEPLYAVVLPSAASVAEKGIVPGLKIYYAPSMPHTSYIFLPDLIKMKGSDASWKHNQEAPPECQDFSDDEEEAKARGYKNVQRGGHRQRNPRFQNRPNRHFNQRQPTAGPPPIPQPMVHFPHYPPPSAPVYYPNVLPPGYCGVPQYVPPPPPPAGPYPSRAPQPRPPVQDMRHWNRQ